MKGFLIKYIVTATQSPGGNVVCPIEESESIAYTYLRPANYYEDCYADFASLEMSLHIREGTPKTDIPLGTDPNDLDHASSGVPYYLPVLCSNDSTTPSYAMVHSDDMRDKGKSDDGGLQYGAYVSECGRKGPELPLSEDSHSCDGMCEGGLGRSFSNEQNRHTTVEDISGIRERRRSLVSSGNSTGYEGEDSASDCLADPLGIEDPGCSISNSSVILLQDALSAFIGTFPCFHPHLGERELYRYLKDFYNFEDGTVLWYDKMDMPPHLLSTAQKLDLNTFALSRLACIIPEVFGILCNYDFRNFSSYIIETCKNSQTVNTLSLITQHILGVTSILSDVEISDLSPRFRNIVRVCISHYVACFYPSPAIGTHYQELCKNMLTLAQPFFYEQDVFERVEFICGLAVLFPYTYELKKKIKTLTCDASVLAGVMVSKCLARTEDANIQFLASFNTNVAKDISFLQVKTAIAGGARRIRLNGSRKSEHNRKDLPYKPPKRQIKNIFEVYEVLTSIISASFESTGYVTPYTDALEGTVSICDIIRFIRKYERILNSFYKDRPSNARCIVNQNKYGIF